MSLLTDMTKMEWAVVVFGILLLTFIVWATYMDQSQWSSFAAQHNCKVVAETESTLAPIVGGKNMHVAVVPGTRTYLCDDGIRYTRSK